MTLSRAVVIRVPRKDNEIIINANLFFTCKKSFWNQCSDVREKKLTETVSG